VQLPARDAMSQLPARLTFGLAELPEGLVCWVCVALAHGVLHLCEHGCEVLIVVNKCRLVGSSAGCLVLSLGLRSGVGQPGLPQLVLAVSKMERCL